MKVLKSNKLGRIKHLVYLFTLISFVYISVYLFKYVEKFSTIVSIYIYKFFELFKDPEITIQEIYQNLIDKYKVFGSLIFVFIFYCSLIPKLVYFSIQILYILIIDFVINKCNITFEEITAKSYTVTVTQSSNN